MVAQRARSPQRPYPIRPKNRVSTSQTHHRYEGFCNISISSLMKSWIHHWENTKYTKNKFNAVQEHHIFIYCSSINLRDFSFFQNSNVLSAILCLIKEIDGPSLEVVEMAVRCRMEELED